LAFVEMPTFFGLGILFDFDVEWSVSAAESILPHHDNKLHGTI